MAGGDTRTPELLNTVHVLRAALGEDAIASTGDGLLLNPSRLNCDLHELRTAIAADAPERIAKLYTGSLLDGFHLDDSTDFGYWLDERRSELSHAYMDALRALAERQKQSGDVHGRVGTCRRLVAADPHSGVYAQALMHALDDAGDRAGAIQHASEHAQRLRAELDLEPDAEVVALAKKLRAAPARPQPALNAGRARSPSVAVLPFLNLSADAENEYFADGITEDVIAHLSKIRALKVISRTSVMPFKKRQHSLKEIGATLGTTTLLDGSIRHIGDRVRIVAKLIDVASDQHLWAETYDREVTDIFAIQTDVALQIAAALKAELSPDERTRVRREPTKDLQAYQLFLKGREWFIKYTPEGYARAIEYFDRAIARDPTFALAFASVAMTYTELAEMGTMAPDEAYQRAAEASANALRLDPELGDAHCTMGYLKGVREFDWSGAELEFKRAMELSPSGADTYDYYGRLCAGLGRYDEAIALQHRAQELDPLAHRMDGVTTLIRADGTIRPLPMARMLWSLIPATTGRGLHSGGPTSSAENRVRVCANWRPRFRSPVETRCGSVSWVRPMPWRAAQIKRETYFESSRSERRQFSSHLITSHTSTPASATTIALWTCSSGRWQTAPDRRTASKARSCWRRSTIIRDFARCSDR